MAAINLVKIDFIANSRFKTFEKWKKEDIKTKIKHIWFIHNCRLSILREKNKGIYSFTLRYLFKGTLVHIFKI